MPYGWEGNRRSGVALAMRKGVRKILVRGVNRAPLPPDAKKIFFKFEEGYSRIRVVIISLTNQSSLVSLHSHSENGSFCIFHFLIFHPFFLGVS